MSDFPVPTSITEARKFQERLQSLMERFGDVSGSHSKLLTTFMKKHTGKIKGEFDTISSLEKRTGKIMEGFEEDRRPVTNCIDSSQQNLSIGRLIKGAGNRFTEIKGRNITIGS